MVIADRVYTIPIPAPRGAVSGTSQMTLTVLNVPPQATAGIGAEVYLIGGGGGGTGAAGGIYVGGRRPGGEKAQVGPAGVSPTGPGSAGPDARGGGLKSD